MIVLAGDHHSLRVVGHTAERHPAEREEGVEERSDERLLLFVRNQLNVDPARPLQSARIEVEDLREPVVGAHPHTAEVVLAEFSGKPLEPNHRRDRHRAEVADQPIDGILPSGISLLS